MPKMLFAPIYPSHLFILLRRDDDDHRPTALGDRDGYIINFLETQSIVRLGQIPDSLLLIQLRPSIDRRSSIHSWQR
jgi:hypothetical protein